MNRIILIASIIISAIIPPLFAQEEKKTLPDGLYAVIKTGKGSITARLFFEQAPLTVCNFAGLAEGKLKNNARAGQPFYDGLKFHRVVRGYIVQGGDPEGTGRGGPGYTFQDEFSPQLKHDRPGIISMANSGQNANGSQFFITYDETSRLNYMHTVFGCVVDGMDAVKRIGEGDEMSKVEILRVGEKAKAFAADQAQFDQLKAQTKIIPAAPATIRYISDEDDKVPQGLEWDNRKLYQYEQVTGQPVYLRLFNKFPMAAEGGRVNLYVKGLAAKLGAGDKKGLLVAYFAPDDLWSPQVGKELQPLLWEKMPDVLSPLKKVSFQKQYVKAIDQAATVLSEAIDAAMPKVAPAAVPAAAPEPKK